MTAFKRIANGLRVMAGYDIAGVSARSPELNKLWGMGHATHSGITVDHENVMALPAVIRAVNIVANGLAKVPFYVFKQEKDSQTWDKEHPSWDVVTRKPNNDFTSGVFRKTMTSWAILYGNAVSYIHRPNWPTSGDGMQLIPLLPDRTYPERITRSMVRRYPDLGDRIGKLYYTTRIDGETKSYAASNCIHIRGLGPNPYWGWDIVDILREAFGGVLAAQEFGNRFYGQGANPAGFIESPSGLDEEAEERFIKSVRSGIEGMGKSHRLMLLEEGSKFHKWTTDPDKAQFLEGKEFDVRTIAMAIGVKVHKLIDSANSSYKSLESANQEHRDDDLLPWIECWKEELSDKLLTTSQAKERTHTIDVDDEYLQWSPFAERAEGCVKLYQGGLIDKDEGRRRVNFGPSKSPNSRRFLKPLNHAWEDEEITQTRPAVEPSSGPSGPDEDDNQDDEMAIANEAIAKAVTAAYVERIAKRLFKIASAKASKGGPVVCEWLDTLKAETGPAVIQPQINRLFVDFAAALNETLNHTSESDLSDSMAATLSSWISNYTTNEVTA